MKLIDKLAYKTLKKVLNLREEFKTTQEIEEYQLSKLKKKLKHAYKKSNYWHEKITQWSQEYNKTPKEFIKEIKSTKDYTKKIPVTTREEISKHGREMTTKSLDKLIETQTSGTSTNKSLKIYKKLIEFGSMQLANKKTYENAGLNQYSKTIIILPEGTSLWNYRKQVQSFASFAKFKDLNKLSKKDITEVLQSKVLQAYTNAPLKIFNHHQKAIKEYLKNNGEVNLELIVGGGDFLAEKAMERINELLKKEVTFVNPIGCVEAMFFTYCCKEKTPHLMNNNYFIELKKLPNQYFKDQLTNLTNLGDLLKKDTSQLKSLMNQNLKTINKKITKINLKDESLNNELSNIKKLIKLNTNNKIGEVVVTPLYMKGMHYFRYPIGDVAEIVSCNCESINKGINLIGRVHLSELHKSLRKESIENIIYESNAFKQEKISGQPGVIETEITTNGRQATINLQKGRKFQKCEEELIKKSLINAKNKSNEYVINLYTQGTIKNWDLNFKIVDELPTKNKWIMIKK